MDETYRVEELRKAECRAIESEILDRAALIDNRLKALAGAARELDALRIKLSRTQGNSHMRPTISMLSRAARAHRLDDYLKISFTANAHAKPLSEQLRAMFSGVAEPEEVVE